MELPLNVRHADAICIDHMMPTPTGAHVHTESISTRHNDPTLRRVTGLPAMEGYAYLTFGDEITGAFGHSTGGMRDGLRVPGDGAALGVARAQGVLFQFLRGIPAESADRYVVRLDADGLTLADVAARADRIGLPVEVSRAGLSPGAGVDPHRLIGLNADMGLVPVADAEFLRVAPARHWAPAAYTDVEPDVLDLALQRPYPKAGMIFDSDGVRLGLPGPLARRAYADALGTMNRPLRPADVERTGVPGRDVAGYGDLLATMSTPGTHAFVTVESAAGTAVFAAVHDAHGVSFLDPGTAGAAVFPLDPDRITVTPADGVTDVASWLRTMQPVVPMRRINRSAAVHALPVGDGGRSVDVIGAPAQITERFAGELTGAARDVDAPVIVVATENLGAGPTPAELHTLEWQLMQHQQNQLAGGAAPIVVIRGNAGPTVNRLLDRYDFAVVQQSTGAGGGMLSLDNVWVGGNTGRGVGKLTGDFLRAAVDGRPARATRASRLDDRLADFLSTPLDDVAGLKTVLAEQSGALRTLAPEIRALGVQPDLFAAWEAILRIEGRGDAGLSGAAYDYLGGGEARQKSSLSFVPAVLEKDPETRGGQLTDLIDLTKGPLDDGASRAILEGIKRGVEGAPDEELRQLIYQHSTYLPQHGRTDWIRQLQDMARQQPSQMALFEKIAVYVETCP